MEYIVPALILALIVISFFRGKGVYEAFIRGAKQALPMIFNVLPYMAAMLCALNLFRVSGALGALVDLTSPAMEAVGIPGELTPLIVLRPFSGGAALALLEDVFQTIGPDSYGGIMASIMLGSTETIFYTVALYFGSINIKKTRHSIPVALISGVLGIAASVILTNIFF